MMIRGHRLAALALVLWLLAACGGDDAEPTTPGSEEPVEAEASIEDLRAELSRLIGEAPLDEDGVACAVDAVIDNVDIDTVESMAAATSTDALPKAQLDIVTDAVVACS